MNDITHPDAEIVEASLNGQENQPEKPSWILPGDPVVNVVVPILTVVLCAMSFPMQAVLYNVLDLGRGKETFIVTFATILWCGTVGGIGLIVQRFAALLSAGVRALSDTTPQEETR